MSRKSTPVNKEAIESLRHFVRSKSNLSCNTFSQINMLRDEILKSTNSFLSVQTLSRFFGVIQTKFNPSLHTLNTVAQYLDYESFQHFERMNESGGLKNVHSNFIAELFLSMFSNITSYNSQNVQQITKNVLKWMNKNQQYNTDIYLAIAKTGFGKKLFFEQFVNVDALNNGFGKGISYLILHADSNEQKFYGYTISCFRYFLTEDEIKFHEYFELMQEYKQSDILTYHPAIVDHYYAALIYKYGKVHLEEMSLKETAMMDFDMLTSSSISSTNVGYHVAEALVLTGQFQRAWEILNNTSNMGAHVPACLKSDFEVQVRILKLLSGLLSNNMTKRRSLSEYLELVNLNLPLLAETYFHFFMLCIKYKMFTKKSIRKQVKESMEILVKKTGFEYLAKFFDKVVSISIR